MLIIINFFRNKLHLSIKIIFIYYLIYFIYYIYKYWNLNLLFAKELLIFIMKNDKI